MFGSIEALGKEAAMGAIKSYTSFDYEPANMVPVIASFDTEGHIKPIYVRLNGIAYHVDSYWVCSHFADILEYNCKVAVGDCLRPLKLTYYGKERVWLMPPGR